MDMANGPAASTPPLPPRQPTRHLFPLWGPAWRAPPPQVPENVCHTRQGAGEQHHYHLPGACSAIETSLDWVEAAAGRAAGVDAAGPFAMSIKT